MRHDSLLCLPKEESYCWVALAKAPKSLLQETPSVELGVVSKRKAGRQRAGALSFVTGHKHQCFFPHQYMLNICSS